MIKITTKAITKKEVKKGPITTFKKLFTCPNCDSRNLNKNFIYIDKQDGNPKEMSINFTCLDCGYTKTLK